MIAAVRARPEVSMATQGASHNKCGNPRHGVAEMTPVIPAEAGIQSLSQDLDPGFLRGDEPAGTERCNL